MRDDINEMRTTFQIDRIFTRFHKHSLFNDIMNLVRLPLDICGANFFFIIFELLCAFGGLSQHVGLRLLGQVAVGSRFHRLRKLFEGLEQFIELVLFLRFLLARKKGNDGHDDKAGEHRPRAHIDRRAEEIFINKGIDKRCRQRRRAQGYDEGSDTRCHAECKARPAARPARFFPVQAEKVRREKRPGERAPAHTHHLGDKGKPVRVVYNGDDGADDDKHSDEQPDQKHLAFRFQIFFDSLDEIERERRTRTHDQGRQRAHRRGDDQNENESNEHYGQAFGKHCRNNGIIAGRGVFHEQSAEAAEEVAPARNDERKNGGNDHSFFDGAFALDGVKFLHHLRQPPRAEAGQNNDHDQPVKIGPEKGCIRPLHVSRRDLRKLRERFHQSAPAHENGDHDDHDAEQHDDALYKIVPHGSHISADEHIHRRNRRHDEYAHPVRNIERHRKQASESFIEGGRVRDQKDENDDGSRDFQLVVGKALAEIIGHGGGIELLRHDARAPTQDRPCEQRSEHRVADADPRCRYAEIPAELPGVSDKNDRRKIRRAVCERGEPRPYRPAPQNIPVHRFGAPLVFDPDEYHHGKIYEQYDYVQRYVHFSALSLSASPMHMRNIYANIRIIIQFIRFFVNRFDAQI